MLYIERDRDTERDRDRERVYLRSRGLLHEVKEIGGRLNSLRDLISHHGLSRAFSAAPAGR